jgi:hypothetical protein
MWYWHWADAVSFWYPSLRLFYQRNASDWTGVLKEVKEYLYEETDSIARHPS